MTQPTIYLWRMVIFLAAVGGIAAMLAPDLIHAFQANPLLNGVILAVLLFGIGLTFSQVLSLMPQVDWVAAFRAPEDWLALPQTRLPGPAVSLSGGWGVGARFTRCWRVVGRGGGCMPGRRRRGGIPR